MKKEDIRLIEAWFDGEANPEESDKVESLLSADPEAKAFLETLQNTRDSLKVAFTESEVPVSWNVVRKQAESSKSSEPGKVVSFPRMVSAAAAIVVLGMALWYPMRQMGRQAPMNSMNVSVEMVETDLEGATPVVYLDQPSGWTVVWVVEESDLPEI